MTPVVLAKILRRAAVAIGSEHNHYGCVAIHRAAHHEGFDYHGPEATAAKAEYRTEAMRQYGDTRNDVLPKFWDSDPCVPNCTEYKAQRIECLNLAADRISPVTVHEVYTK